MEPMDTTDTTQDQEPAPEQSVELSPSSRGRQRKKNTKFLDYEVSNVYNVQTPPQKRSRRTTASQNELDHDYTITADEEAERNDGELSKKTPKKTKRGRKPTNKKTPGKKANAQPSTAAAEGDGANGEVQNETPKPKRKYTKRKKVEELPMETKTGVEEDVEETPGARPKRGAAKAALKYLHSLARELEASEETGPQTEANGGCESDRRKQKDSAQKTPKAKGGRGVKRKRADSDAEDDKDFVPNADEDEEEEELEEEEDFSDDLMASETSSTLRNFCGKARVNGLMAAALHSMNTSNKATRKFRQEHHSPWEFPDWLPSSSDWQLLPQRELEGYLPEELQSAAFTVSREGAGQDELQRLDRFASLPSHPDRWDMLFFCGGPVWAMEWCPSPEKTCPVQYLALSCYRDMDETHRMNRVYSGPGLVQIWDVGALKYDQRPETQPSLAYALAQDKGFVWQMKWCPSGAWEQPNSDKQPPLLPRLGLLAVATSLGLVTIYSLPHPDALLQKLSGSERSGGVAPVFKARSVVSLKLGSFKAPRLHHSGQVLSLDWLQHKPHNVIAAGFYDGNVGLWDLGTKSSLLRVREPDSSMTLLPFHCFLAHDHAVRALAFCPAAWNLLVTTGEDRFVKTWDLRRASEPLTVQKRYLSTEVYWPLDAPGLVLSEETAFTAFSSHGMHYYDHYLQGLFPIPRSGTMWSLAYSDWLNFAVTSDTLGEVILTTLAAATTPLQWGRRAMERRFPVQYTSTVPFTTTEEEQAEDTSNKGTEEVGRTEGGETEDNRPVCPKAMDKYRDAVNKYYLQIQDFNLRNFANFDKRPMWRHMRSSEARTPLRLEDFPLAALHKIRFSPNLSSHTWMSSAGQSGLVRLFCVRAANYKSKNTQRDPPLDTETTPERSSEGGHADGTRPL